MSTGSRTCIARLTLAGNFRVCKLGNYCLEPGFMQDGDVTAVCFSCVFLIF